MKKLKKICFLTETRDEYQWQFNRTAKIMIKQKEKNIFYLPSFTLENSTARFIKNSVRVGDIHTKKKMLRSKTKLHHKKNFLKNFTLEKSLNKNKLF